MTKPQFVSLHSHSDSSLLDGFSKVPEYLDRVVELGQPGFGLTEHGNVTSINELIQESKKRGITPVPGCEFYVAPQNPEGAKYKSPVFYGAGGIKAKNDVSSNGAYTHQTMWAYNEVGLHNLFKLSTLSWQQEHYYSAPRIDFDMIAEHSEGLIAATGCPSSEISTRFLLGQQKEAYEYAYRMKEIFGDRLFVEIMDHNMPIELERDLLPKQVELAKKMGLGLLATQDSHYTHKHEAIHHEEQLCGQSGSVMSEPSFDEGGTRFKFSGNEYYLKTAEEMAALFPEEDFPGALSNTLLVAEMAQDVNLEFDPTLKPKPRIPAEWDNELDYYVHLLELGFQHRYGNASPDIQEEARRRMAHELEVIHSSDFIGYMITVHNYLKYARDNYSTFDENGNVLALSIGVGRGSVGGSIHAYLLYISELCPIKHDLIFERFLSAGRGDTYLIEYEDGTSEEIIVSEKKRVRTASGLIVDKYIHELELSDSIIL